MHPGGVSVLLNSDVGTYHSPTPTFWRPLTRRPRTAGQDATEAFYGLHKQEVLERPQYKRLVIGTIQDEEPLIVPPGPGAASLVPYAEPTWLTPGYHSPYFKEVCRECNLPSEVLNSIAFISSSPTGSTRRSCVNSLTMLLLQTLP